MSTSSQVGNVIMNSLQLDTPPNSVDQDDETASSSSSSPSSPPSIEIADQDGHGTSPPSSVDTILNGETEDDPHPPIVICDSSEEDSSLEEENEKDKDNESTEGDTADAETDEYDFESLYLQLRDKISKEANSQILNDKTPVRSPVRVVAHEEEEILSTTVDEFCIPPAAENYVEVETSPSKENDIETETDRIETENMLDKCVAQALDSVPDSNSDEASGVSAKPNDNEEDEAEITKEPVIELQQMHEFMPGAFIPLCGNGNLDVNLVVAHGKAKAISLSDPTPNTPTSKVKLSRSKRNLTQVTEGFDKVAELIEQLKISKKIIKKCKNLETETHIIEVSTKELETVCKEKEPEGDCASSGTQNSSVPENTVPAFELIKGLNTVEGIANIVGQPIINLILDTRQPMDTVISVKDGKLGAHRVVLAAASPFLEDLLLEQDKNAKSKATLILPDITRKSMEHILSLVYTGKVIYSKEDEDDLFNAMKTLYIGLNADLSLFALPKPDPPPVSDPIASADFTSAQDEAMEFSEVPNRPLFITCSFCSQSFPGASALQTHVENYHRPVNSISDNKRKDSSTFEEFCIVTFCHGCNRQWKTLDKCQKCLISHGLARCWKCLDVFDRRAIRGHYMTNHCDESSIEDAHNTFIKCRWCPKRINVKNTIAPLCSHSISHIPEPQSAKRRGRRSTVELAKGDEDLVLEETKTVDGVPIFLKYKTLKGEETQEMELRSIPLRSPKSRPEPKLCEMSDSKKLKVNLAKLPRININLCQLPQKIEDKIFRRAPPPKNLLDSSKGDEGSKTGVNKNKDVSAGSLKDSENKISCQTPSKNLLDSVKENENENDASSSSVLEKRRSSRNSEFESDKQEPSVAENMTQESPQPISIVNLRNITEITEDTETKKSTAFNLYTRTWGQLSLVAHNISKHCFNGFPDNPTLLSGRASSTNTNKWKQLGNRKSEKTRAVFLRIQPSESTDAKSYSDIFAYFSTNDRLGVISGTSDPQSSSTDSSATTEFYLLSLTKENHSRLVKLWGGEFEYQETEMDVLIVVVMERPVEPPKTRGRKRKRTLESPESVRKRKGKVIC